MNDYIFESKLKQPFLKQKMKIFLLLSLILTLGTTQGIITAIYPSNINITQTQASPQACYANCQSCQTLNNQCQQCYSPYFVKNQDGTCDLQNGYTLESSSNQLLSGRGFIYTTQSWGNITQTDCNPSSLFLNAPLRILGPFSEGNDVTYVRTVSFHQYIIVRFQMIRMNWDNSSQMNIVIFDQNSNTLASQHIQHNSFAAKQQLCSDDLVDQRFAILFQIGDRKATTITIRINFKGNGKWGIATWLLLTGLCNPSCSNCSFSNQPTQCIGCNSFFIVGSDRRCSQCSIGFKLVRNSNGQEICQKCQIQYQQCIPGQQICFYNNLQSQVNKTDCTFKNNSDYASTYDVDSIQFPGSLFTVSGKPATYQCGAYSIVGSAQQGDSITRIFANLRPHYFISITFNVFIIDQATAVQTNLFVIILDNVILQANYLNTQGVSDVCTNPQLEAFTTYPATKFYPHNRTLNSNLTIASNATNWGIRNLRLAFQVCDQSCLECGPEGCLKCEGMFQLENLKCQKCPVGYGIFTNKLTKKSTCVECPQNCRTCSVSMVNNTQVSTCLQCTLAYFLFENKCLKRTNIARTISVDDSNKSADISWVHQAMPNSSSNGTNLCKLNLFSKPNRSQVVFAVSENLLTAQLNINQSHHTKIVQFYLIKIDKWKPTDILQVYLNDLLLLSKNYSNFGNDICFNSSETDYITFQEISFVDSNSSLSISFQVVTTPGEKRKFGVADFRVHPVGCSECKKYPFQYKIDYNYDQFLNVHVQFNRVYVNHNVTLFKQIFTLMLDNKKISYDNIWNNSVTYILKSQPSFESVGGNLTLICQHPQLVKTDTKNKINKDPFFSRQLQQTNPYFSTKIIDNNSTFISVARYSPPQNHNAYNGLQIFFQVISRIVIYIGFASFFFGCQTVCTHFMHNLQKIWLHIFIAALATPNILRYAIIGFRETQNQNIAINPSSWQKALPLELYYETPSFYKQYYTDVSFLRNIYNIAIAFVIIGIFSIIAHYVLGKCNFSRNFKDNVLWRHLRITFVKRHFFIFNSLIFYQYLTLVLACTLQFTAFMNSTNQQSFGGINAAGAIVAFVFATLYPLAHFYYLQKKKAEMEETSSIQYTNKYGQIFYRFLPRDVWMQDKAGITYAQQIYNLFRFGQIWWICIISTALYSEPQSQCYLLIITNLIHFSMILFTSFSQTLTFKLLKVFQLGFFIGLEILILVCQSQQETLTSKGFYSLGAVGVAFLFAIVGLSSIRSFYTLYRIRRQYYPDPNEKYMNVKMRNQDYFQSKDEQIPPSQRDN